MDWQQTGSTRGAVKRQSAFNLGGLSVDNWIRIQEQNEKPISVIIGNPPYNANQQNENDNNRNREYPEIDRRISETYVAASTAQKTKQYDMYKRFIRWASDRLADDGIIAFITNRAYLDTRQDDGFRQIATQEFSDLYVLDLGSDVRRNPKIAGTTHNVFGIQTGVAVGFFVRDNAKTKSCDIHYASREDAELAVDKLAHLRSTNLEDIDFQIIVPDRRNTWLSQSDSDFADLMSLVDRRIKPTRVPPGTEAMFAFYSMGASSNRDEWVYDLDFENLHRKARYFTDTYNSLVSRPGTSNDPDIKWSAALRAKFDRGEHVTYRRQHINTTLYRPFVSVYHYADMALNDRLTRNHHFMFGSDLRQLNKVINFCANRKAFYALATDRIADLHFTGDTQCLPLYFYSDDVKVSNITALGFTTIPRALRRG